MVLGLALLSASTAQHYFGKADPIGQTLYFHDNAQNEHTLTVAGIIADDARPRHVRYDVLISYTTLHERRRGAAFYESNWGSYVFYTYAKLRPSATVASVEAALQDLVDQYKPRFASEVNAAGERIRSNTFTLVPLRSIHLYSARQNELAPNGNGEVVRFLGLIALFIVLLAWTNYINLTTARSVARAREVGVRKALGSDRSAIRHQFLLEAFVTNGVALVLALGLVLVLQPWYNAWIGASFSLTMWSPQLWALLLACVAIGALLAGAYPAWVMASFEPLAVLKGTFRQSLRGVLLRRGLVVTQFAVSMALMVAAVVVYQQMQHMLRADLGFRTTQTLIVDEPGQQAATPEGRQHQRNRFKAAAAALPGVEQAVTSSSVPGQGIQRGIALSRSPTDDINLAHSIERVAVDHAFLDAYEMQFLSGRNFDAAQSTDAQAVVLNASAAQTLGFARPADAVGAIIYEYTREPRTVIGVLADYHHESLVRARDPMYFVLDPAADAFYSIQLADADTRATLAALEAAFASAFPGSVFRYTFLDTLFDAQYRAHRQLGELMQVFALLAMLIACLGLYGLAAFTANRRLKEMGIRKVLGASSAHVLGLLLRDLLLWVVLAALVTLPFSWMGTQWWLDGFAYPAALPLVTFVLPVLLVVALALFASLGHALRIALTNVAVTLRMEAS